MLIMLAEKFWEGKKKQFARKVALMRTHKTEFPFAGVILCSEHLGSLCFWQPWILVSLILPAALPP